MLSVNWVDDRARPVLNKAEDFFMKGVVNWPGWDDNEYRFN